ncbi:MAG: hypothetical protein IJW71_05290 [Clostridia bacterium]|nr:hypothetical protein [Clostridia bacterium]
MFYQYKEEGVACHRNADAILSSIAAVRAEIAAAEAERVRLLAAARQSDLGGIRSLAALCDRAEDLRARLSLLSDLLDGLKDELAASLYATGC